MTVVLACGVAFVGLFAAYAIASRRNATPWLLVATKRVVRPSEVQVNDWLEGYGRVTDVELLDSSGVLLHTSNELIVCPPDDNVTVLRPRARRGPRAGDSTDGGV